VRDRMQGWLVLLAVLAILGATGADHRAAGRLS
jgi:hypothetical protein